MAIPARLMGPLSQAAIHDMIDYLLQINTVGDSSVRELLDYLWSRVVRTEEEMEVLVLDPDPGGHLLVGRFTIPKTIGALDLCTAMKRIWGIQGTLTVSHLRDGVFLFDFGYEGEYDRALYCQPWTLNGSWLVLGKVEGNERPEDVKIEKVPVWIQIHRLEVELLSEAVGSRIGEVMGDVLKVELPEWGDTTCLRVRVLIGIDSPLKRCTRIVYGENRMVVLYRYEKLAGFCCNCGSLLHVLKECPVPEPREFPDWLRAEGRKGISDHEIGKFIHLLDAQRGVPNAANIIGNQGEANNDDDMAEAEDI